MNALQVSGMMVEFYLNDSQSPMEIGKCGYLGRLDEGSQVIIRATFDKQSPNHRILLVSDTNRENTRSLPLYVNAKGNRYADQQVRVMSNGTSATADQNTNCVRLIEMDAKGFVLVTNIEVICQKGDFFGITRQTYRVQAYKGERSVAVPGLFHSTGWPELAQFVISHYESQPRVSLPSVREYKDEVLPDVSDLPDANHLRILNWSTRRGAGAGLRKDGTMVKLHHSNVIVAPRTPIYLIEGEVVRVQSYRKPFHRQSRLDVEGVGIVRVEFDAQMASA